MGICFHVIIVVVLAENIPQIILSKAARLVVFIRIKIFRFVRSNYVDGNEVLEASILFIGIQIGVITIKALPLDAMLCVVVHFACSVFDPSYQSILK